MEEISKAEQLNTLCKNTLVENLGIVFISAIEGEVIARMPVDARTIQPFQLLHGGASLALAETVASAGSAMLVDLSRSGRVSFRNRWRELMDGDPTKSRIYKDIGNGVATAGIEYYLPLFFEETATVFDYLGENATVVLHGDLEPAFQHFWQDTKERYRLVQGDPERPALPPESLFLGTEQFYARVNQHAQLAIRPSVYDVADNAPFQKLGDLTVVRGADDPLARLKAHIQQSKLRVLVLAESDGRERLFRHVRRPAACPF